MRQSQNQPAIRHALQRAEPDPHLLTRAERLQYEGFKRRQNADDMIRTLLLKGTSIKAIVRATGYARKTVRQVARGGRGMLPGAELTGASRFPLEMLDFA